MFAKLVVIVINLLFVECKLPLFFEDINLGENVSGACDNFYKYSCRNWMNSNKKPPDEPVWNQFLIANYQIKENIKDILHLETNDPLIRKAQSFYFTCLKEDRQLEKVYLKELKFLMNKEFGGWQYVYSNHYDWLLQLSKIIKLINIFPVLKITTDVNILDPNGSRCIYIEPGSLIYPEHILIEPLKHKAEIKIYHRWIYKALKQMNFHKIKGLKQNIINIINFEINLAKMAQNNSKSAVFESINELYKIFPLCWKETLTNLGIDFENKTVIVKNLQYLQNLFRSDKQIIGNYFIWSIINELSSETTKTMRDYNHEVNRKVLGLQSDYSRLTECLNKVEMYLSHIIIPKYVELYLHPETYLNVNHMIENIKNELIERYKNKKEIVKKIKTIGKYIGYEQDLDRQLYNNLSINNDNHFLNILKLKYFMGKMRNNHSHFWPFSPFEVNAFYNVALNAIYLPLGILHPPFYKMNAPLYYNYGGLGTLIGHELSHSLDGKFILNHECFLNNSRLTVLENIADDVGFKIAFNAYRKLSSNNKFDLRLFYIKFAQNWCEIAEKSYSFINDEHAPSEVRVNQVVINNDLQHLFNCRIKMMTTKCNNL